jgi:hypothetical protein
MKVLFVNVVKDLAVQKAHYPLGFGYLVSYCRKQGLALDCAYSENLVDMWQVNPGRDYEGEDCPY